MRTKIHRPTLFTYSSALVCGVLAFAAQDGQTPGDQLRPVLPTNSEATPPPAGTGSQAIFDGQTWRARLGAPNLVERERNLDAFLTEALRDAGARTWLDAVAAGDGELAWTARLARRELALRERSQVDPIWGDPLTRRGLGGGPLGGRSPLGGLGQLDPWGGRSALDLFDDLQKQLDALMAPGGGQLPQGGSQQGISFQLTPNGVRVEVSESVDGEQQRKTYAADSLEALLEQHPELRDQIGRSGFVLEGLGRSGGGSGGLGAPNGRGPDRLQAVTPDAEPLRTDILGVMVTALEPSEPGPRGLRVHDTVPGTIAHLLGVSGGDVLVELNGTPLRAVEDISRAMRARAEGAEVRLLIVDPRGNERTRVWRPMGS